MNNEKNKKTPEWMKKLNIKLQSDESMNWAKLVFQSKMNQIYHNYQYYYCNYCVLLWIHSFNKQPNINFTSIPNSNQLILLKV